MGARKGDWVTTYTGGRWWPHDPRPEDVRLGDQQALVQVVRFGGHCRQPDGSPAFYSVMQHEVLVAELVAELGGSPEEQREGLFHDGHEVYPPGDVLSPVLWYDCPEARALRALSVAARDAFRAALRLPREKSEVVRFADAVLLATEKRDFVVGLVPAEERPLPPPLRQRVAPWPWDHTLARFRALALRLHGEAP